MEARTKEYYDKAIEVSEKQNLVFIEDVCANIGISKETYYRHFPLGSDGYDFIKAILEKNKIKLKVSMRKKWFQSDAPALQIGLYKLIGTDEERTRLGDKVEQKQEVTVKEFNIKDTLKFVK